MSSAPEARSPSGFTLLRSLSPILTKKHTFDPILKAVRTEPYAKAKHFTGEDVVFDGIDDLADRLGALIREPRAALTRGSIVEGTNRARMRRLRYPELAADGTEGAAATLEPCPRSWAMADVDLEPIPDGLNIAARPGEALKALVKLLPGELQDVDLIIVWSSSAGVKQKLAAHVFLLLAEPVPDEDLTRWALARNLEAGQKILDPAVFRPAQLHYVATPIFVGLADPIAERLVIRRGSQRLASLSIPEAPPAPERRSGQGASGDSDERLAAIGGPLGFHDPIVAFVGAYVHQHGARGTDRESLAEKIAHRVAEADPGGRDQETIDRYSSRKKLFDLIDWTIRRDISPKQRSFGTGPYEVQNGRLVYKKIISTRDGDREETSVLTNFTATIDEERTIDDGAERKHVFQIVGALEDGTALAPAEVPAASFTGMNWLAAAWGSRPFITAGQSSKDRTREAIQRFSTNAHRRTIFQHTGWRKLEDKTWGFLHARGAMTSSGNRPDVDVRTEDLGGLANVSLPDPPDGDELRRAVRSSIDDVLGLAPMNLTAPLLGAIYRAPLCELVENPEGLFYVGKTGVFKTELLARGQQHYGSGFHGKRLPAGWGDTANSLERVAFGAKDTLLGIDDFAPAGSREDLARQHANIERILRSVGNVTGRGRMRPDGSLRPRYYPRGIVLSTAEDLPRLQSARARCLILQVEPEDVDVAKLTASQQAGAAGTYSLALAGYVRWLAGRLEDLRSGARQRCDALRAAAFAAAGMSHRRTPEAVAHLAYGIEILLQFAEEVQAVTPAEASEIQAATWEALLRAGEDQASILIDADPVARFERLLRALFTGGHAHVKDSVTGGAPPFGALALGWSRDLVPQGRCVGWAESEAGLLLEPEGTYAAVQELASRQHEPLTTSKTTLWKRLAEAGKLLSRDERYTTVRRQGLPGGPLRLRVLHFGTGGGFSDDTGGYGSNRVGQVGHVGHDDTAEAVA